MPTFANRTTAFSMCATLNCAEPVPFIDAPMVFHYEDGKGTELWGSWYGLGFTKDQVAVAANCSGHGRTLS